MVSFTEEDAKEYALAVQFEVYELVMRRAHYLQQGEAEQVRELEERGERLLRLVERLEGREPHSLTMAL